jgi:hypothetical protein
MILIFDIIGGLNDMFKDFIAITQFIKTTGFNFTIRYVTTRDLATPWIFNKYELNNLFNEQTFFNNDKYISFELLKNDMNNENTYDMFSLHIKRFLWNKKFCSFLRRKSIDLIETIQKSKSKYFIIGGSFWSYYHKYIFNISYLNLIIPSNKILECYNKIIKRINQFGDVPIKYNFIHYRYENDWIPVLKKLNREYIVPPLDLLIEQLPFKNNYPIYIATSNILLLHKNKEGLIKNEINTYANILYKFDEEVQDLNFDEAGFVDFLIGKKCEEIYGCDFSVAINKLKNTKNYYTKIKTFMMYVKNESDV